MSNDVMAKIQVGLTATCLLVTAGAAFMLINGHVAIDGRLSEMERSLDDRIVKQANAIETQVRNLETIASWDAEINRVSSEVGKTYTVTQNENGRISFSQVLLPSDMGDMGVMAGGVEPNDLPSPAPIELDTAPTAAPVQPAEAAAPIRPAEAAAPIAPVARGK